MNDHNPKPQAIRAEALEALLTEKGLLTSDLVDDVITRYSERVGPMNGARLVAKAWCDDDFKRSLLDNATEVVKALKLEGGEVQKLVVVENTARGSITIRERYSGALYHLGGSPRTAHG